MCVPGKYSASIEIYTNSSFSKYMAAILNNNKKKKKKEKAKESEEKNENIFSFCFKITLNDKRLKTSIHEDIYKILKSLRQIKPQILRYLTIT